MNNFIQKIKAEAQKCPGRIVFPEGEETRVIQAVGQIIKEKTGLPILVGRPSLIKEKAKELNIDISSVDIVDIENKKYLQKYSELLYEIRKEKGLSQKEAETLIKDFNYFGTVMVAGGDAEGMISGTTYSTGDTIKPALQIIKTKEKFHKVSGLFIMILEERTLLFADTAVTIEPNSHDLADIAIDTAETAKRFNIEPKVAFLSFSTKGSANHSSLEKIREAIALTKTRRPDLLVDGEMQVDAALVPEVSKKKCPDSKIAGEANVLIFPDLNAGNIAYKLVERLAKAKAIGPILQGLKKPINDLSRGCSSEDIANLAAITSLEICDKNFN